MKKSAKENEYWLLIADLLMLLEHDEQALRSQPNIQAQLLWFDELEGLNRVEIMARASKIVEGE